LGVNEDFVVARHRAVHLPAVEGDRDDVVRHHLVEPDARRLHEESLGIVGKPHADMSGYIVALSFARQYAPGVGEPLPQSIAHLPLVSLAPRNRKAAFGMRASSSLPVRISAPSAVAALVSMRRGRGVPGNWLSFAKPRRIRAVAFPRPAAGSREKGENV